MTTLVIKGETSDGEPLEQTFQVPSGQIPEWKRVVRLHAIECLWEARWIPGSVSWQVFTIDNIALPIGENY